MITLGETAGIWRFAASLPEIPVSARVSLGEGNTPVIPSRRLGPGAGLAHLHFKLETVNPTGSYKDRFAAMAVSHMQSVEAKVCFATSSGNTGAALAAYCAAAGLRCRIVIVETAPDSKLRQMLAYGAELCRVRGFGLDPVITEAVFEHLRESASRRGAALQISAFRYSPVGMTGVETIGFELADQFAQPIDHVFIPAGGGGLTLAVARGFLGAAEQQKSIRLPRIECVQPEGNDTIASAINSVASGGAREVISTTQISGLQVGNVLDGDAVVQACLASGGHGHLVTDEEVWEMQARLAREEGFFCEPAGAVSVAAAIKAASQNRIAKDATIVCLITGSGFKDEKSLDAMTAKSPCPVRDLTEWQESLLPV
jgi:threonine synthase